MNGSSLLIGSDNESSSGRKSRFNCRRIDIIGQLKENGIERKKKGEKEEEED